MPQSSKICPEDYKYYDDVAQNIKYYRNKRRYTQEQLAEFSNISRTYLSSIENANPTKNITYNTIINIAKALDVEPFQLIKPKD